MGRLLLRPALVGALAALMFVVLAGACGEAKTTSAPTSAPKAAGGGAVVVAHTVGAAHTLKPKRLEATVEIDMHDMYFANPQGEKNPVFKVPAGKTIGIHIHNEGAVVHELAIGRKAESTAEGFEYAEVLSKKVPGDLFFYYGDVKAEVEGAMFGELEVETGVRDIWIRMIIPPDLKGEWELGCFVEGHYEGGMKATLLVE